MDGMLVKETSVAVVGKDLETSTPTRKLWPLLRDSKPGSSSNIGRSIFSSSQSEKGSVNKEITFSRIYFLVKCVL
jgi:hypothetical protein